MASELSRMLAVQAWCSPATSHIEMDVALAEAFAELIDKVVSEDKAELKAKVCDDLHAALRVDWGKDPYAEIQRLQCDSAELEDTKAWLNGNTIFSEAGQPLVLATVSARIWYHATDDTQSCPFTAVVAKAMCPELDDLNVVSGPKRVEGDDDLFSAGA